MQTTVLYCRTKFYFSCVTRRQHIFIYGFALFVIIWGVDLLNLIKFRQAINWSRVFSPFNLTALLYASVTIYVTHRLSRRFVLKRNWGMLAASFLGVAGLFILLRYSLEEMLLPSFFGIHNYNPNTPLQYYVLDNVYYGTIYVVLGFLIFLFDNHIANQKIQAELLQKSREAELQYLRAQINPHFLFNTINNLYALVYEKSSKAPDALLKLAGLMRYLLYERKETVTLAQEWRYMQDFIALQQLRLPKGTALQISATGDLEQAQIIPHLLFCFVENAFKHGDLRDDAHPLCIHLTCTQEATKFVVSNKIGLHHRDDGGGVGLANVRRRLELLYPNKHELRAEKNGDQYVAELHLKN